MDIEVKQDDVTTNTDTLSVLHNERLKKSTCDSYSGLKRGKEYSATFPKHHPLETQTNIAVDRLLYFKINC